MFSLQLPVSRCAFLETVDLRDGVVYSLQNQFGGQTNWGYVERESGCLSGRIQTVLRHEQILPKEHTLELTFCRPQFGRC